MTQELDADEVAFLYWVLAHSGLETHTGWWDSRLDETPQPLREIIIAKILSYRTEWEQGKLHPKAE